jgi:hypothetical protein
MRKLALFVSLCLLSISAVAQSSPQMISEVNVTSPKPGMTAQWEAGRKRHSDFHAAQAFNRATVDLFDEFERD